MLIFATACISTVSNSIMCSLDVLFHSMKNYVLLANCLFSLPTIIQPGKKLFAFPVIIVCSSIAISPYQLWLVRLHYLVELWLHHLLHYKCTTSIYDTLTHIHAQHIYICRIHTCIHTNIEEYSILYLLQMFGDYGLFY